MGDRMRALIVTGAVAAALILDLSACVYVPVEPAPPYRYVAPLPVPPSPPVAYRRCARGWHWVHGHYNRWGRWVPSHCARNWVSPSDRTEEPAPTSPAPA